MRHIKIVKADEVTVSPFIPRSFNQNEEFLSSIGLLKILRDKSSKKAIRKMAKEMGISQNTEKIHFARRIINTILDETSNGK